MHPQPSNQKLGKLAIDWPAQLGNDCLGLDSAELDQLSHSLLTHSPRSLRLSPACSVDQLPFTVTPVPWHDRGYWLDDSTIRPGAFLQFAAGDYYIQDASSMLAISLCRIQPGQIVCDLCAAPGGKASGLLEQLNGKGFLLANEVIQSRLALLRFALYRTRFSNHAVSKLDAQLLAEQLPEQFDCVLVDAPCSGQSMVGRDKQSTAAFTTAQVDHSAARQQRIISEAARLVRPGGRLVYSTCTFAIAENELIIEQFLQQNNEWRLDPLPALDRWASPRMPGMYRLWPHRDSCDGGFAAALIRSCSGSTVEPPAIHSRSNRSRWQTWASQLSDLEFFETDTLAETHQTLWQLNDSVHLFCESPWQHLATLSHAGIEIAQIHPKRIEPTYAGAIVQFKGAKPRSTMELTGPQAIQYVRGEGLSIAQPSSVPSPPHGWTQVCWNGRPLSWGKYADGKLKNHFPKLLRNAGVIAE